MSILIKGAVMPTSCGYCTLKYRTMEGDECMFNACSTEYQKRPDDCPLVPVPPHGRLIDAGALDDAFTDLRWENGDYKSGALRHWGDRPHWCLTGSEVENLINVAPTIIPASEEGE